MRIWRGFDQKIYVWTKSRAGHSHLKCLFSHIEEFCKYCNYPILRCVTDKKSGSLANTTFRFSLENKQEMHRFQKYLMWGKI